MPDLVGRVTAALRNPGDSPWLPGLTAGLADRGWENLYHDTGLMPSEYGTARVMTRDRNAPRKVVSVIPSALDEVDSAQAFQIELLDEDTARPYEEAGIKFYSEDEINELKMTERITEAANILKSVPTLFQTVAALVRSVHLIDAGDDEYDVSFSEPHLPFSIFVSVPARHTSTDTLRVSEAIVHETMHLQLTLVEQVISLFTSTSGQYYSPWRREFRSPQGILHGLYVFLTVDEFFYELRQWICQKDKAEIDFIGERRAEIRSQISQLTSFQDSTDLTVIGTEFARRLLTNAQRRWAGEAKLSEGSLYTF